MRTRADQLFHALAFALQGIKVKGRAAALSKEDRYAIARAVVDQLRKRGDLWDLDGELARFSHCLQRPGFDLRQYNVRLWTGLAYPVSDPILTGNGMKLPYDPPTMLSDIVSSVVMLGVLLAAFALVVTRAADELPGTDKDRSNAGAGTSL